MKIFYRSVWALGLVLAVCNAASADICSRHFYNNSNRYWTVMLAPPSWCGSSFGGSCLVKPHQTIDLHYNSPFIAGSINVNSPGIYNGGFVTTVPCRIEHSGNTGRIAVNDPADGDVSTCGSGSWSCGVAARRKR
jgi:hypothetical protein